MDDIDLFPAAMAENPADTDALLGRFHRKIIFLSKKREGKRSLLKVPKCEIFDRSDFDDFYTITSLCEGDFRVKIKKC